MSMEQRPESGEIKNAAEDNLRDRTIYTKELLGWPGDEADEIKAPINPLPNTGSGAGELALPGDKE